MAEVIIVILFLYFVITQVLIRLAKGLPYFPAFRKSTDPEVVVEIFKFGESTKAPNLASGLYLVLSLLCSHQILEWRKNEIV